MFQRAEMHRLLLRQLENDVGRELHVKISVRELKKLVREAVDGSDDSGVYDAQVAASNRILDLLDELCDAPGWEYMTNEKDEWAEAEATLRRLRGKLKRTM